MSEQDWYDGFRAGIRAVREMTGGSYDQEVEREAVALHLEDKLVENGGVITGGCRPPGEDDPADYGPPTPDACEPDETYCLRCGYEATAHKPGRHSIYGVCPGTVWESGLSAVLCALCNRTTVCRVIDGDYRCKPCWLGGRDDEDDPSW